MTIEDFYERDEHAPAHVVKVTVSATLTFLVEVGNIDDGEEAVEEAMRRWKEEGMVGVEDCEIGDDWEVE